MLTFAVSEEKNRWLKEKMESLNIREGDIIEKFIRSSGKGGQKVNKTSTCVYIKHIPTGIEVKCMEERSQSINRFLARRELVERIERLSGKLTIADSKRLKAKKQKQKRQKRAKLKHRATDIDLTPAPAVPALELNEGFCSALHVMEDTDRHVFITGRAGTGKSTLLQHFRQNTKKAIAVLAPTGVAAVNVRGQTIHSFFNFKIDITPDSVKKIRPRNKTVYKKLDAVVIDEISMVRADILDCVDIFLRLHGREKAASFGGIQMIFIGDLYQLPPVVTSRDRALFMDYYKSPYFFAARVFEKGFAMEFIELEKVYRQKDEHFLKLLNAIRNNTATDEDMREINSRHIPEFREKSGDFSIHLTTTNNLAEGINIKKLAEIKDKEYRFTGALEGNFETKDLPTGMEIVVKTGAQVMLLNNDSAGRWINGSLGKIMGIEKSDDAPDTIMVELSDGEIAEVAPYTWEMYKFSYDKNRGAVVSEPVGSFTQYPLKLAWAVTIHKSQGMTFERAIIDIGRGTFSHGQLYVALSRCTTLEGMILKQPVAKKNILMDRRVVEFVTKYQYRLAEKRQPLQEKISFLEDAIKTGKQLEIVYLKTKDEKSKRVVTPLSVGELEYSGKKFPGLKAFCLNRGEERVFHIERILEMRVKG
ncbi:MAG: AAA family ATPase [Deltaproteobacteria bacterium]|nr:AAA family ATPase [Deltaproteobacteria bacterium]